MSRQKHPIKFSDVFPIALFAFTWVCLMGLTYYAAGNILDADASNVLVMSNFLAQNNAIASTGWRYYTELHVLNMQLVYSFFFHLFTSWRLVRFFGAVTLQAIFVASYGFLCKQAKISRNAFFYSATMLLLPASVTYARIVLFHAHYTFHIALAFILIGLLLQLTKDSYKSKYTKWIALILYVLVGFLSGTNGMRQLYISLAPACLVCIYLYLRSEGFRAILQREKGSGDDVRRAFFRTFRTTPEGRGVWYVLIGTFANVVGIATNLFVLRKFFGFSTYYSMKTIVPTSGELVEKLNDFINLLGYRADAKLFSVEGVGSLLSILAFLLIFGFSIWYLTRAKKSGDYSKRVISVFLLGAFVFQTLVFLITANYYIHYYTPVYVYIALLIALMIDEFPDRAVRLPRICAGVLMVSFLVGGFITTNFLVNRPSNYATKYEGLVYSNIDQVKQIKPATQYLKDNGYTFGYTYYWDSSVITELTDGVVEVCAIVETPDLTYSYANTKKAFWDINYHSGKTFFLVPADNTDAETYPIFAGGMLVYSDEYYKIYEYPAPIPFEISKFAD